MQKSFDSLENLDWPENVKRMQRNWIGKSNGAEIKYKIDNSKEFLTTFLQDQTLYLEFPFLLFLQIIRSQLT